MLNFYIITLFPEYFSNCFTTSITYQALKDQAFKYHLIDLRAFGSGIRKKVDDRSFGGGPGMIIQAEPIFKALEYSHSQILDPGDSTTSILLSPKGPRYNQEMAGHFASNFKNLIIFCGHYEGYDVRIEPYFDHLLSLGDFIMTGGEPATVAITDSIIRLLPGVIKEQSLSDESYLNHNLEYDHYTKPRIWNDKAVPEVLISGNHQEIAKWRSENSEFNTKKYRPDLPQSNTVQGLL